MLKFFLHFAIISLLLLSAQKRREGGRADPDTFAAAASFPLFPCCCRCGCGRRPPSPPSFSLCRKVVERTTLFSKIAERRRCALPSLSLRSSTFQTGRGEREASRPPPLSTSLSFSAKSYGPFSLAPSLHLRLCRQHPPPTTTPCVICNSLDSWRSGRRARGEEEQLQI